MFKERTSISLGCCFQLLLVIVGCVWVASVSTGSALSIIAKHYHTHYEHGKALKYDKAAWSLLRLSLPSRERDARFLNNIGLAYESLGQYQEASKYLEDAAEICLKIDDPEAGGCGTLLSNIGMVNHRWGKYDRALDYYQQALAMAQENGNQEGEGMALNNIGSAYHSLGQNDLSLDYYQRALTLLRDIKHQEGEGATLGNLGVTYSRLGQYERALTYHQQALAINEQISNRSTEAVNLYNIGVVYSDLGQYERALDYFQQCLSIEREIGARGAQGSSLNSIGHAYMNLGQPEQALNYLQQALAVEREVGDRGGEGATLSNISHIYIEELSQYTQGLEYLQQALAIQQETGDCVLEGVMLSNIGQTYDSMGQHEQGLEYLQQALAIQQETDDLDGMGTTLAAIGTVYEHMNDIDQAIEFYQKAVQIIELIQAQFQIEELQVAWAGQQPAVYESLIGLLWEEGRFEEAFNYVERARARAFLDQLAAGAIDWRTGADATLLKRENKLRTEIAARHAQLTTLHNRPHNESDLDTIADVQNKLTALESEYEALLVDLKLASPESVGLVSVDVASLADIQRLLDDKTTLVEYFVTQKRTLAFVITQYSFEPVALNVTRQELMEAITSFRDLADLSDSHPADLQQLLTWLIVPLESHLTTPMIGVVPHDMLHYLPFAALTDGHEYLGDKHALFTLPSGSALRFLQENRKPDADSLLALGNPIIDEPLPELRFARQEVEQIAELYGTRPLVGADATESVVWSQAGKAGILHLAVHGEYNRFNPLFSALLLAPDSEHDGRLEVHEIYGLDLTTATDLVVLSGCETQIGELSAGDEIVGLNRAFLYAGTPSVIASLWNVDDEATALLMEQFHTYLGIGMSKAEALQQAQIEVRATHPHPYYWAAFVLSGDPGE